MISGWNLHTPPGLRGTGSAHVASNITLLHCRPRRFFKPNLRCRKSDHLKRTSCKLKALAKNGFLQLPLEGPHLRRSFPVSETLVLSLKIFNLKFSRACQKSFLSLFFYRLRKSQVVTLNSNHTQDLVGLEARPASPLELQPLGRRPVKTYRFCLDK